MAIPCVDAKMSDFLAMLDGLPWRALWRHAPTGWEAPDSAWPKADWLPPLHSSGPQSVQTAIGHGDGRTTAPSMVAVGARFDAVSRRPIVTARVSFSGMGRHRVRHGTGLGAEC